MLSYTNAIMTTTTKIKPSLLMLAFCNHFGAHMITLYKLYVCLVQFSYIFLSLQNYMMQAYHMLNIIMYTHLTRLIRYYDPCAVQCIKLIIVDGCILMKCQQGEVVLCGYVRGNNEISNLNAF